MQNTDSCLRCGGDLIALDENRWQCKYCGSILEGESVKETLQEVRNLFDSQKQEMISNIRQNLFSAVTAANVSNRAIKDACVALKRYLPNDFAANFYEIAVGSNEKLLAEQIRNIDVDKQSIYIDDILNLLIRSMRQALVLDVMNLCERAYKNKNLRKYEDFSTRISEEAAKVDSGIYETKLPRDVFVAYSSKDMKPVLELVDFLEDQGLTCFVALRNLRHGLGAVENYSKALQEAMDHCRFFVFVSSLHSRQFDCDAWRMEMPYIKDIDINNAPSEYRNDYRSIPARYKKPRVEYRIEESGKKLNIADKGVEEFFDGYERAYSPKEVAKRIADSLQNVGRSIPKSEEKATGATKICVACAGHNPISAKYCQYCTGSDFANTMEEHRLRRELDALKRKEAEKPKTSWFGKKALGGIFSKISQSDVRTMNKRVSNLQFKGKMLKFLAIFPLIIAICGAIVLITTDFTEADVILTLVFSILAIAPFKLSQSIHQKAERYKKYIALIFHENMLNIQDIAESSGIALSVVETDIKKMIEKGFLKKIYYIEAQKTLKEL